jgi:hypothetical protein
VQDIASEAFDSATKEKSEPAQRLAVPQSSHDIGLEGDTPDAHAATAATLEERKKAARSGLLHIGGESDYVPIEMLLREAR